MRAIVATLICAATSAHALDGRPFVPKSLQSSKGLSSTRASAGNGICPSTFNSGASIPKGTPYVWLRNVTADPADCLAACCGNITCVKWVHTKFWTEGGAWCVEGAPCCLLYNGQTHDVPRLNSPNITSGEASPWHLELAGVFSHNMVQLLPLLPRCRCPQR